MTKLRSQEFSFREALCHPERTIRDSANHRDSSGLARSLALSFSRVAAARRIPVLPRVLQRNSGFLTRARHARGNDRKKSTERTCVSLSFAGLDNDPARMMKLRICILLIHLFVWYSA